VLDEAEGLLQLGVVGGDLAEADVLGAPLHSREDARLGLATGNEVVLDDPVTIFFFGFLRTKPRGEAGRRRGSATATVMVVAPRTRGGGAAVGV
jgi:hypothetical protein